MKKIDFKKELSGIYQPTAKAVSLVEVPPLQFLMVDGQGDPNTSQRYAHAVEALFSLSYTLKFGVKKSSLAIDYGVMPLEGLWWADDMTVFTADDKSSWQWTMMIMQPDFIDQGMVEWAAAELVRKKKNLPLLSEVRFETYHEGTCAQILHIGPFAEEGPTVAKVHAYIEEHGQLAGKHHEIYLSDIRRASPEKWKTIVRQPLTVRR
jgi:hypothetical protein